MTKKKKRSSPNSSEDQKTAPNIIQRPDADQSQIIGGDAVKLLGRIYPPISSGVSAPPAAPIQPRKVTLLLVLISIVAVCVVMECAILSGVIIRGSSAQRRSQGGAGGKMPPKVSLFSPPPKKFS